MRAAAIVSVTVLTSAWSPRLAWAFGPFDPNASSFSTSGPPAGCQFRFAEDGHADQLVIRFTVLDDQ
jgi:hypothetical protein